MTIDVNGVTLYYEVMGQGSPLILVHGNGEDHTIFREAAEKLSKHYTCYLVDSRGHGQSSRVKSLHYRDMAEDYMQMIRALELKDVTFFGFSDGGILGLLIGAASNLADTILVSGANLYPKGLLPKVLISIRLMYLLRRKELLRLMMQEPDITPEELAGIRAKVFVLAGEKDLIRPEHTALIAESIPNAVIRILPGETHGSHIVHSTKIADLILELTAQN